MSNAAAITLALIIVALIGLDLALGWGGTLAVGRWLFGVIDWLAFWRYL